MLFPYEVPTYIPSDKPNYVCLYYLKVNTPYKLLVNPHWIGSCTGNVNYPEWDVKFTNCNCDYLYEFIYVPNLKTDALARALIVCNQLTSLYYIVNQTRDMVVLAVDNSSGLLHIENVEHIDDEIIIKAIRLNPNEFLYLSLDRVSLPICMEYIRTLKNEEKKVSNKTWLYKINSLTHKIPDNIKKNKEFQRLAIDLGFLHLLAERK